MGSGARARQRGVRGHSLRLAAAGLTARVRLGRAPLRPRPGAPIAAPGLPPPASSRTSLASVMVLLVDLVLGATYCASPLELAAAPDVEHANEGSAATQ